jgi:uridine kinase
MKDPSGSPARATAVSVTAGGSDGQVEGSLAAVAAPPDARALVLGIVGDSGSGKSTVADAVARLLGERRITDLRLDDYHRYTREERAERGVTALNPIVHNFPLMQQHIDLLRRCRPIRNRTYRHADGSFGRIRKIEPNEIVLVRGLLGFPTDELEALYDLSVFLRPEPELLFRWKLRRDVQFRGYTEAEVLKSIARHLVDSKSYVLPQAERADLLVHYELPDWEAPDSEVRTTLYLRRKAAELARESRLFEGLPGEQAEEARGIVFSLPARLDPPTVNEWALRLFPDSYVADEVGTYVGEEGESLQRSTLTVVEVAIARLAVLIEQDLRRD